MSTFLRGALAIAVGTLLTLSSSAFAQDVNTMPVPRAEVSAGYVVAEANNDYYSAVRVAAGFTLNWGGR